MTKRLSFFGLTLGLSLVLALLIHKFVYYTIAVDYDSQLLLISYVVNFLLAFGIVFVLGHYIKKLKHYIGFLFMIGSLFKFGIFFVYFYPVFKADGMITTYEFLLFFVPYGLGLVFETIYLSRLLNKV